MTRIYIYEAVCLTVASGIIGTIVGILVALCLTVQYLTFAEIPMKFHFPGVAFGITFMSGILTAILGSYLALREIRDRPISNIMKGLG
jgi:ABC-type antimicrobial peptide transport system permease subunit